MRRSWCTSLVAILLGITALMPFSGFLNAQGGADGFTNYELNLRVGPGADYALITILPSQTGMVFEGRNADSSWLLGHTEDGAQRGWVASLYFSYTAGFNASRLPVSDEILSAPQVSVSATSPAADAGAGPVLSVEAPTGDGAAPSGIAPNLDALPLVSGITPRSQEIYQRGQALGNSAKLVTKVGECNSMSWAYLRPFDHGNYELGAYAYLQSVIDHYDYVTESAAAAPGFTSTQVLDSFYANPGQCNGLSPLECEYQHARPAIAFIMLGMMDVNFLTPAQYEEAMRKIIETSIEYGVIPVLTTFPIWPDGTAKSDMRFQFNSVLVSLSQSYGVPLANYWKAAQEVQHSGVGVDHVHITERYDNFTSFNGAQYVYGMDMWNLVALQVLAALQQQGIG